MDNFTQTKSLKSKIYYCRHCLGGYPACTPSND